MARLALISVSDKTGIVALAQQLVADFDFELISSGGTAATLKAAGLPVKKVSDYTGAPEILGGRVKTLHPRIHGGILGRPDLESDREELSAQDIRPLDLVVVNLYPFEQTIAQPGVSITDAIEQIDIGGPAMLRASAKNHAYVTVISNPRYYGQYLEELRQNQGKTTLGFRQKMAGLTFALTASYDIAIANYFHAQTQTLNQEPEANAPNPYLLAGSLIQSLRYGENPHQTAAWYQTGAKATGWVAAEKLQGKDLSYNNLVDLEAARRLITEFASDRPTAAILKHTNPCGVAQGETLVQAYEKAFQADAISAFGGIVALNSAIDSTTAQSLTKTFLECIVAPGYDEQAQAILATKPNLRVLILPELLSTTAQIIKLIAGGFLTQESDDAQDDGRNWQIVTEKSPSLTQLEELKFAWRVAKHVKSNAIVVTHNTTTLGIGAGQMNRVGSVAIALAQAGEKSVGAVLASDGFFPFDDSVRTAAQAGIRAIIQPGGSMRDKDSIAAANELGLAMILTGKRHFLH
jgi:phosphoribosylaminoimidazolecarboxamide formyltransferase/IMP cyclohydrolase